MFISNHKYFSLFLTHIPDPPVVFPFPKEHPELSLLLNHDLQPGERRREKNTRVIPT